MALYVNTNISSLNAQRNLTTSGSALATSLQRLSSGLRVNSAKDDAAGLAIASGMDSQVRGSNQAIRNANDGISLAQTAEGALSQIQENTQRMRELTVQASNSTVSSTNLKQIQKEMDALGSENGRLITSTKFNGQVLFGSAAKSFNFQVGANSAADNQIKVKIAGLAFSQAAATANNLTSNSAARNLLAKFDKDLGTLANARADLGATQNRFTAVVANLQNYVENISASKSRIVDADFASETATMTRNQIIQQAGTAMLSQANQLPQTALSLLK